MIKRIILLAMAVCAVASIPGLLPGAGVQRIAANDVEAYLGEVPPGKLPVMFSKDFLMTGMNERDTTFTPDGKEMYFTISVNSSWAIVWTHIVDGKWTKPEVAPFSGHYQDIEPMLAPDGNRLYFASNRPAEGSGDPVAHYDIWYVDRTDTGWGEPVNPGAPVNTDGHEFYPSATADGTLYFCSRAAAPDKVYRCRLENGVYQEREDISGGLVSHGFGYNPFVSPDEQILMFSTTVQENEEDFGGGDLYISFRGEDGAWKPAVNMGIGINTSVIDFCPYLTVDGKYLFFTSRRVHLDTLFNATPVTVGDFKKLNTVPGRGNFDIYWVDAGIIDDLRTKSDSLATN